jgi:hypothetical protein
MLGFTNALGEPVCCVIIIASKEVRASDIMGVQPWAEVSGDPAVDFEDNSNGPHKYYPHGPSYIVNGKTIPAVVICSDSGSIPSDILTILLQHLDQHLSFDRTEATPFLLLDGHGSRFELPFLDYINTDATKWTVCIGVPYGTNLWQVGDSAQQNGAYKSRLSLEKHLLVEHKQKMRMAFKIERHDVVGLVHRFWLHSLAKVESSKRAIAERGWNPLTYNLIDHKELNRAKDNNLLDSAY